MVKLILSIIPGLAEGLPKLWSEIWTVRSDPQLILLRGEVEVAMYCKANMLSFLSDFLTGEFSSA